MLMNHEPNHEPPQTRQRIESETPGGGGASGGALPPSNAGTKVAGLAICPERYERGPRSTSKPTRMPPF